MASSAEVKTEEQEFKFEWEIPNWNTIQKSVDDLLKQKFTFETPLASSGNANWEVGFVKNEKFRTYSSSVAFYYKLLKLPVDFKEMDTDININLLHLNGTIASNTTTVKQWIRENDSYTFQTGVSIPGCYSSFMADNGSIKFSIVLTLRFSGHQTERKPNLLILEEFNQLSAIRTCTNWASVYENKIDSDLTLVTSDNQEFLVHKLVLKVQCPHFATTFHSQFSKNTNSTLNTTEISAKTMQVFLHYLYSGELLKTWCENDVIVEFTAAVARFKMLELTEMLDKVLGNEDGESTWENDWKLFKLTQQMSLQQAEKRLNDRILNKTRAVQNADELMTLLRNINMTEDKSDEHNLLVRANSS